MPLHDSIPWKGKVDLSNVEDPTTRPIYMAIIGLFHCYTAMWRHAEISTYLNRCLSSLYFSLAVLRI
ncbi:unnamed protein product [Urochloa humidicola]